MFDSFREIIDSWPTRKALALAMGTVTVRQVQKWHERDFIPCENWERLVAVSRRSGDVTLRNLAELAAQRLAA